MSNGTPSIQSALAAVKAAIGAVGKDSRNTKQGFDFRGIDAVVNAAAPHLNTHGVIVTPMLQDIAYSVVEVGQNRTSMGHVRVTVMYRFTGPCGDHLDAVVPAEAMDSGDKGTAKAMSVAYRIALLQVLNLPTCEPDPDSQSYERSPREAGHHAEAECVATVTTDSTWFDDMVAQCSTFKTHADGVELWGLVNAKGRERGVTVDDAQFLKATITAQQEDLRRGVPAHAGNGNGHVNGNGRNGSGS